MQSDIVTIWKRWTKNDEKGSVSYTWEHNHYSIGYDSTLAAPVGMSESQTKSWKNGKWLAIEGRLERHLDNRNVLIESDQ